MNDRHRQDESIPLRKGYTLFPHTTKSSSSTVPFIDPGLVKAQKRRLPFDLQFAPIQVDDVVFHFPLPPVSRQPKEELSPIDSAVCIPSLLAKSLKQAEATTPVRDEEGERSEKRLRRETRADIPEREALVHDLSLHFFEVAPSLYEVSTLPESERDERTRKQLRRKTKVNTPRREISLHPLLPQAYEAIVAHDPHRIDLERQKTLAKLQEQPVDNAFSKRKSTNDTKRQLANTSPSHQPPPPRIGLAPPWRPAPKPSQKEDINPDFQSSSEDLRRRAASISRQRREKCLEPDLLTPPPTPPKSPSRCRSSPNIRTGTLLAEKSTYGQPFDQARLECQSPGPEIVEMISQVTDDWVASPRCASRGSRREILDERSFDTSWRSDVRVQERTRLSSEMKSGGILVMQNKPVWPGWRDMRQAENGKVLC